MFAKFIATDIDGLFVLNNKLTFTLFYPPAHNNNIEAT